MTCQGDVSRMGQCSLLLNELNWTHYKKQKQMSLKYSLEKKTFKYFYIQYWNNTVWVKYGHFLPDDLSFWPRFMK